MKLLPKQTRVDTQDSLGLGIEAAVIMVLFFGVGFGLDRLFGTTPIFMIVLSVLGAVGLFAKWKYRYDDRMNELEAERVAKAADRSRVGMNDSSASADLITTRLDGPSPEVAVSTDMIKRGLVVGPFLVALCGVIWGMDGVWSSAYGIAIVLANFALAAAFIASAARISLGLMMAATLFGYLIRLALIFLAVWLVKDAGLDFVSGTRIDHHHHAPRSVVLGDEVRRVVAGASRTQTDHDEIHRLTRYNLAPPDLVPPTLTTETETTCSDSSSRRSTRSCAGRTSSPRSTRSP